MVMLTIQKVYSLAIVVISNSILNHNFHSVTDCLTQRYVTAICLQQQLCHPAVRSSRYNYICTIVSTVLERRLVRYTLEDSRTMMWRHRRSSSQDLTKLSLNLVNENV